MKVTIEKVERLMERADIGYEAAKDALEAANGDLLDAVIALERDGKLGPNAGQKRVAAYTTGGGAPATAIGQSYGEGAYPQAYAEPNFVMGASPQPGATDGDKADKKKRKDKKAKKGAGAAPQSGGGPQYGAGSGGTHGSGPGQAYGPNPGAGQTGAYGPYYGAGSQAGGQYGPYYGQGYGTAGPQYGPQYGASGAGPRPQRPGGPHKYKDESTDFEDGAKRFAGWLGRVIRAGVINYFELWRKGERIMYFPVILFLFCLIPWVFWVALVLIVIGLFCGCRYRFSGPHLGRKSVNDAMDKASDIAEDIKSGENAQAKSGANGGGNASPSQDNNINSGENAAQNDGNNAESGENAPAQEDINIGENASHDDVISGVETPAVDIEDIKSDGEEAPAEDIEDVKSDESAPLDDATQNSESAAKKGKKRGKSATKLDSEEQSHE